MFMFASLFNKGQLLKERISFSRSKFFPLQSRTKFGTAWKGFVIQRIIQEVRKLFPSVKKWRVNRKMNPSALNSFNRVHAKGITLKSTV